MPGRRRIPRASAITTLATLSAWASNVVAQNNVCTFTATDGSRLTFQRGESIHSYRPNRCLDSETFPCYCNPDAPGQIECPYCWILSKSGDLLCVEDGGSITYTALSGEVETCDCILDDDKFNSFSTDCRPAPSVQPRQGDNSFGGGSSSQETCSINGMTYERGESLGFAISSGCSGSMFDFQCFCNPDLEDQIECPYCYFDVEGKDNPICLRDGEIATLPSQSGQIRTCGCFVPDEGSPSSNCFLTPSAANTCVIEISGGSLETFAAGESLHRRVPSGCGADYPCYCEPTVIGQVWCPYCVYAEGRGSLICAGDGESVTYTDRNSGVRQTCTCEVPFDPRMPPTSSCSSLDDGSTRNQPMDDDDGETVDSWRVCELNGNLYFEGESLGDSFETRCGPATEFPCFCNPKHNPPVDCPYCGFALSKDNLLCLKDEQVASFVDIDGDNVTCGCSAPMSSSWPSKNCLHSSSEANTCVFRDGNGDPVIFDEGEPVDNDLLPVRYCGPSYQCFCDPTSRDQLSCPFCVEVDFGGNLICARDGEVVFYQDQNGLSQRCSCVVPDDLSTESPRIQCGGEPVPAPAPAPTSGALEPTSAPESSTRAPEPSSDLFCETISPTGETVLIPDGESFGSLTADGVCGSTDDWPAFCDAITPHDTGRLNNEIEYPYCIFTNTLSGETVCARDGGTATFVDETGTEIICSCIYGNPPLTSCELVEDSSMERSDPSGTEGFRFSLFSLSSWSIIYFAGIL